MAKNRTEATHWFMTIEEWWECFVWHAAMIVVLAMLHGCSAGERFEAPALYTQSYREQFPDTRAGCITLWTMSECKVSPIGGEPTDCATGEDALIVRSSPNEWCVVGMNYSCDCADRELESQ
jgi:hypothetical protein